jgi:membrane associated rhomboid family serine protease
VSDQPGGGPPAIPPPPDDPTGYPTLEPPGRESGLQLDSCYRHPDRLTGVHCTRCGRPICPDCMRPAAVGYQCPDDAGGGRGFSIGGRNRRVKVWLTIGRPGGVTTTLIALNVLMFLVEVVVGGPQAFLAGPSNQKAVDLGALFPPAVALGHQYWRLITAMFLHAGILHIALNMYALYLFGYLIEEAFGKLRFIAIYLVCGFLASVASFAFGPLVEVGVGASGAIFGLLGAWVAYNYRRRDLHYHRANLQGAFVLIVLNLILSFSIPGIDWRAHVGGLVAGVVAGTVAEGGRDAWTVVTVVGFVLLVAAGIAITAWRVVTFPSLSSLIG